MPQSTISDRYDTVTLLGSEIGLASILPVDFTLRQEYTLNADLNIFPNEEITVRPKLRYYGVGINGCYNVDDSILSAAYNPQRMNMNLYHRIPFRCVPIDEDLTDEEREKYRLRQRKTINGQEYFLYWLKVIDYTGDIQFKRINPADGSEEAYELDPSYLHPTPVKPSTNLTLIKSQVNVIAYTTAVLTIEASEVLEYIKAYYEGDTRYAKISEIGFYTGVDKEVTGLTAQNTAFNYTEAIYTMLYDHATWQGTPLSHEPDKIESVYQICSNGAITEK